jgi:hypothetical protein
MIRLACFVSLGLGVFSFLIFVVTLLQRPRADRGPELTSGPEGWAKLGEAGAKVIDAFTKAGPTLSALIASLFFVGVGAYLSLNVPPSKPPEQKVITIGSSVIRCVIEGFPDGRSDVPAVSDGGSTKDYYDCIDSMAKQISQDKLLQVLIIGRVDKRELRAKPSSLYGSNLGLAYQRAVATEDYLMSVYRRDYGQTHTPNNLTEREVAERVTVLPGGPRYVGPLSNNLALSHDRSAEIIALWVHNSANTPDATKTDSK